MPLRLRNLSDFREKVAIYREEVGCSQDEAETAVRTMLKARYDQRERWKREGRDLTKMVT